MNSACDMKISKTAHDTGRESCNFLKAVQCRPVNHLFSKAEVNSSLSCLPSGFISVSSHSFCAEFYVN